MAITAFLTITAEFLSTVEFTAYIRILLYYTCTLIRFFSRCVDTRSRLPTHDQAVRSQTDRNMKLTGALRRTARFLENSTVAKEE